MQRHADWYRDSEGRGYPGAVVTVYNAGTSTKPQLYSASGSITSPAPISNPTSTDPYGYYAFAVPNGTYDIHLQGGGMPTTIIPNITIGTTDIMAIDASSVTSTAYGVVTATNVQGAIEDLADEVALKLTANAPIVGATKTKITFDADGLVTAGVDATAADIVNVPAGGIAATNVQAAINELDTVKVAANVAVVGATKTKITFDAKGLVTAGADATATDIVNTPYGSISAVTVQNAINELDDDLTVEKAKKEIKPITASVAANALTVTINPQVLEFRSATLGSGAVTQVTIANAISVVVPAGATLGTINGKAERLAVIAINNAGTAEAAVVNLAGGSNLDETTLISTTAISDAADSATVIYSTSARSNVAFRVCGFLDITEATAGTWATAPSTIQGAGGQALALASMGFGQRWQNVAASRAIGTTYYNLTSRPIEVKAGFQIAAGNALQLSVGGIAIDAISGNSATVIYNTLTGIVPPGASYVVAYTVGSSSTMLLWAELR